MTGDEKTDFIKGVGVQLTRKMEGELYNRRIKITGDCGVMHETMQLLKFVATASWTVNRYSADLFKSSLQAKKVKPFGNG